MGVAEVDRGVTAPERRRAMGRCFDDLPREHGFEALHVEGRMPPGLRGTLYRNGPGVFRSFDLEYEHWFDGDGTVTAVRIGDDGAFGACRVTQNPQLLEERNAGRALYSTGFTLGPVWWRRLGARAKNLANINVLPWQGRIFALPEMEKPIELSPASLDTRGVSDLDGVLAATINAHYRIDPSTSDVWGFGLAMGARVAIDLYRLPKAGPGVHVARVPTGSSRMMIHDVAMTEQYIVLFLHPVTAKLLPILLGMSAPARSLKWSPEEGTEILVIPKADPSAARRIQVDAFFHTHFVNAFEDGAGRIVCDYARYARFTLGDAFELRRLRDGSAFSVLEEGGLARGTIDLARGTFESRPLAEGLVDFGTTHPAYQCRPYRHAWALATEPGRDIALHIDTHTGAVQSLHLGDHLFPGEISFCPDPEGTAEEDGWLATLVYDTEAHRSGLAVIDARDFTAGPVAFAWFDHHVPTPIHGCWVPAT